MEQGLIKINGTVEKIIFKNQDSGYAVLELIYDQNTVVVVGALSEVDVGEELEVTGNYITHPSFGPQFRAEYYEKKLPATAGAIIKYLSSGAIKGIGPVTARRMVDTFGDEALEIAYTDPKRLTAIKGIPIQKAIKIGEEVGKNFSMRDLLAFMSAFQIPPSYAMSAYSVYGIDALSSISQNPFLLCHRDIGLDFKTADRMAYDMGVEGENDVRVKAGIRYIFTSNSANGHTCLPRDKVCKTSSTALGVREDIVDEILLQMEGEEELKKVELSGGEYLFLPELYDSQMYIANRLTQMKKLLTGKSEIKADQLIHSIEKQWGITYAQKQRQAMEYGMYQGVFVLTGGPGTGKTTTLKGMIQLIESIGQSVVLAAPTGRAAQRMSEVTGKNALTIHRLLEASSSQGRGGFQKNENNTLKEDVVIIDEVSMVDTLLMEALLRGMKPTSRIILVGDSNQLPSIGPGNILSDIIGSECFATIELDTVFRQAAQSLIVVNAHRIVRGEMPDLTQRSKDFFFLKSTERDASSSIGCLVGTRLPNTYGYSPIWDIQVVSPSRKGELGTENLNLILQEALNPKDLSKKEVRFMAGIFREGDKVMQTKNNYDLVYTKNSEMGAGIFNGDIGRIQKIDQYMEMMTIDFDGKMCEYPMDMLSELELAYAITVHKSQGSEFKAVIIMVPGGRSRLHFRNLLYTAVTRAKDLLILIGNEKGISDMVENDRKTMRYTLLKTMIKRGM